MGLTGPHPECRTEMVSRVASHGWIFIAGSLCLIPEKAFMFQWPGWVFRHRQHRGAAATRGVLADGYSGRGTMRSMSLRLPEQIAFSPFAEAP